MRANEEEARLVSEWVENHHPRCPGCQRDDSFAMGGTVLLTNASASIELEQTAMTAFVTLKCKSCGHVSFLAPDVIGLNL
jgi:hypothetical protein